MTIDFHSHILPGVDDGSKSVDESIAMLKREAEQGIDCVVATPHFYADCDTPERFLRRRKDAENRLREEMEKYRGLPQIKIGAEVHYFRGISDSGALLDLTIEDNSFILLEMMGSPWSGSVFCEIEQIYSKQGIVPIIAHVDRYINLFRDYGIPARLKDMPVLVQANANFFAQHSTRRKALHMLSRGEIHLLGSDCHNMSDRPPNLGPVIQLIRNRLGEDAVSAIDAYGMDVVSHGENNSKHKENNYIFRR